MCTTTNSDDVKITQNAFKSTQEFNLSELSPDLIYLFFLGHPLLAWWGFPLFQWSTRLGKKLKWRDADVTAGRRMAQTVLTVTQILDGRKLYYDAVRPRHRRELRDEHESLALWREAIATKHNDGLSRPPRGQE